MKKTYIVLLIILTYILGSLWYRFGNVANAPSSTATSTDTTPGINSTNTSVKPNGSISSGAQPSTVKKDFTYTNFTYRFSIKYPKNVQTETSFKNYYHLSQMWRAGATTAVPGTPVIAFVIHREQNDTSYPKKYPLYFSSEVRVGVSQNVKNCYDQDAGYTKQNITTVSFNGTTWKKFSFADAGMMQYGQGESYRTIRNNLCYALEQVKTGSNYRDEDMATGTPESVLNKAYLDAGAILKTFTFI
jgi:hypothetical protein